MFILADFDFNVMRPGFGLLFWGTVTFLLFWWGVGKVGFKPIMNALKEREDDIQGALDEAKKAREEMANLKSEHTALLAQAREERSEIMRSAKEAKENIINEARTKAKEESSRIIASAKEQIENEKMAALIDIKNKSGNMALEIAEKILQKELKGSSDQQTFVQKLVDDIKLN